MQRLEAYYLEPQNYGALSNYSSDEQIRYSPTAPDATHGSPAELIPDELEKAVIETDLPRDHPVKALLEQVSHAGWLLMRAQDPRCEGVAARGKYYKGWHERLGKQLVLFSTALQLIPVSSEAPDRLYLQFANRARAGALAEAGLPLQSVIAVADDRAIEVVQLTADPDTGALTRPALVRSHHLRITVPTEPGLNFTAGRVGYRSLYNDLSTPVEIRDSDVYMNSRPHTALVPAITPVLDQQGIVDIPGLDLP